MIRYFDASALVKKYVEEQDSDLVRDRLLKGRAATSRLSEVEITSALSRRCREGSLSEEDRDAAITAVRKDFQALIKVELSPQVVTVARELLTGYDLRAGDAIQLASCLFLRNRGLNLEFLAFDGRLNLAARAMGLSEPKASGRPRLSTS
ncbi:MAG TPA: type II toxin-antitoxin system VapC family toxin [Thermoanaerobaculia bacterium]|nr:type II toxin-antitoxin system VapC family toxin [Thermoanaerobaculia bacterium]